VGVTWCLTLCDPAPEGMLPSVLAPSAYDQSKCLTTLSYSFFQPLGTFSQAHVIPAPSRYWSACFGEPGDLVPYYTGPLSWRSTSSMSQRFFLTPGPPRPWQGTQSLFPHECARQLSQYYLSCGQGVCVYVSVCVYVCVYIFVYVCVCVHVYVCDVCIYVCVYVYMCVYVCVCVYVYMCDVHVCVYM
jgi:hypothetical protein